MAGGFSEEELNKVREASDIVALFADRVPLKQRGHDFWCCCPFHQEKSPSCKVDPSTQLWHCFGCGEGGDVFTFVEKIDDLSFPEAVRSLAERAHIELSESGRGAGIASSKKARLKEICEKTAEFYHVQLMRSKSAEAASAREYLAGRGFGGSVPKTWNLGFAPGSGKLVAHLRSLGYRQDEMIEANVAAVSKDNKLRDRFYNRVMFPIRDAQGDCIAFGGRVIGKGEPKYINTKETPLFHKSKVLFGLDRAKSALTATGTAIICEGYTDVISLHEAGIKNAVATLGTALTLQHIRLISRFATKRIVYLFDGDEAGQRAADRALGFIDETMTPEAGHNKVDLCAVTLPDNLDPAEFVAAHGPQELNDLIAGAKPLLEYGIDRRLARYDLSRPEQRSRALAEALSVLAPIKDSILAKDYAVLIAGRVHVREEDALAQLSALKAPRRFDNDEFAADVPANQPIAQFEEPLSKTEANRRRFERELLSLCAQNPQVALVHADALAQTQWHDRLHESLAVTLLDILAENPAITGASLVRAAMERDHRAANVLTAGRADGSQPIETLAQFYVEELSIGDMQDSIASLKEQLKRPDQISSEEYDLLFESVVSMQKTLAQARKAHKIAVE